jgi:hypothetical protein
MTSDSASRATRSSDWRRLLLLGLACAGGMTVLRAQDASPPAPQSPPAQEAPVGDETVDQPAKSESDGAGEKIDFPDAPDPGAPGTKPAAKPPAPSPSAGAPAGAPEDANADAREDTSTEDEEPPPGAAPRTPGVVGSTPGHFEPTEKVRADFDVSFPVDI